MQTFTCFVYAVIKSIFFSNNINIFHNTWSNSTKISIEWNSAHNGMTNRTYTASTLSIIVLSCSRYIWHQHLCIRFRLDLWTSVIAPFGGSVVLSTLERKLTQMKWLQLVCPNFVLMTGRQGSKMSHCITRTEALSALCQRVTKCSVSVRIRAS